MGTRGKRTPFDETLR